MIFTICGEVTIPRITISYTLTSEQIADGSLELTAIVDIDSDEGNGTEDIIKLFVDRVLVGTTVFELPANNDFIGGNACGFGMTGGGATGGWKNSDISVDFNSGTIDYARGLWYSDDITGIDLAWCPEANFDGIYPIDINDFFFVASNWLKTGTGIQGDINQNGTVDDFDLLTTLSYWLSDCTQ